MIGEVGERMDLLFLLEIGSVFAVSVLGGFVRIAIGDTAIDWRSRCSMLSSHFCLHRDSLLSSTALIDCPPPPPRSTANGGFLRILGTGATIDLSVCGGFLPPMMLGEGATIPVMSFSSMRVEARL